MVEFVIPVTTQAVVLQVKQGDESTEIPVDLSGKPRARLLDHFVGAQ